MSGSSVWQPIPDFGSLASGLLLAKILTRALTVLALARLWLKPSTVGTVGLAPERTHCFGRKIKASNDFEMVVPMGGDNEMIVARAVEQIARRLNFRQRPSIK